MKKTIRMNESELHQLISESVKRVLNEIGETERGQAALGALQQKRAQQGQEFAQTNGLGVKNPYYDKVDAARAYAYNKRSNNPNARNMANANDRGRDAQNLYYTNKVNKEGRNNIINNGW